MCENYYRDIKILCNFLNLVAPPGFFFLEGQNGICHFSKHILSRGSGGPMVPRENFEIRVSETAFPAFLEHFGAKYEGLKSQF